MSLFTRSNQYGKIFGDWTIQKEIASGSQGTVVYQIVRKTIWGEEVRALKAVPIISGRGNYNSLPDHCKTDYDQRRACQKERAVQEVQQMIKVDGHTNIVRYYGHDVVDWEEENEFGFDLLICMELLRDLRSELELNRGRIFSEADAIHIGKDICSALVVCHKNGILHRDIKPENIFFNKDGDYKLGDFGIARECRGSYASTGVGTPAYSAPEQGSCGYDMRVDIYSLGLVLYELENRNRLPFAKSSYVPPDDDEIKKRLCAKVLPFPCDASPELAKVIIKACAHSPEDRFQSAQEMLNALNRIDNTTPIIPRPVSDLSGANDTPSAGNGYDTEMALPDSTDLPPARRGYDTEKARPDLTNANSVQNPAAADHAPIQAVGSVSRSEDFIIENGVLVKYCGQDKDVVLPSSITGIGDSAFKNCSELTGVTFPNSVTSIGDSAFDGCSGLTSVTFPNSVTSIGNSAFNGCSGLTHVVIPNSVTSIGSGAFGYCHHLNSISVANGNPKYVSVGGALFSADQTILHTYPSGKGDTSYCVPSSVTKIEEYAFACCTGLTSVTIPTSVTSVESGAFHNCYHLTSINVAIGNPKYVSVSGALFSADQTILHTYPSGKGDTSYCVPSSVTEIEESAFALCFELTSVTISNSVTTIGDFAFAGCTGLTSMIIPNSVTSIGNSAFAVCDALKNIYYGGSEEQWKQIEINEKENQSLTSATIHYNVTGKSSVAANQASGQADGSMSPRTTSLAYGSFDDLVRAILEELDSEERASSNAVEKNATKDFVIKNGVLVKYCGQDKDVVLPTSITSIGDSAFKNCSGMTSVTVPNSVTSIGEFAFFGCFGLTGVVIPNSVISIGGGAFGNCNHLTSINVANGNPKYVSVGGVLLNADRTILHTYPSGKGDTSYCVPSSVTKIEEYAFHNCVGLTSVTIPNSVTSIGNFAFCGCFGLTGVVIPNSVTSIDFAFFGCFGLTSINVADGNPKYVSVGGALFNADQTILYTYPSGKGDTSYCVPSSVTKIWNYAFYNCVGLTSVTIPNSVTFIGNFAFASCDALKNIYYSGSEEQWEQIGGNRSQAEAIFHYYYNVAEPEKSATKKSDDDLDDPYDEIFQIFNKRK